MRQISIQADFIHGAISLQPTDNGGVRPWRLPFDKLDLFHEGVVHQAGTTAGIRVSIVTDSRALELEVLPEDVERTFDLTSTNDLLATVELPPGETVVRFDEIPGDTRELSIWLPQRNDASLCNLAVEDAATVEPFVDTRPKWVTYGSSITHCGQAHSPARTWPATAARKRNLHLTCLGYGGNCHLEPLVGMMIRDLPADVITLKLGINVQGSGSLNPRTFRSAVIGLISIIREKHPTTPMTCISPIVSPPRESTPNTAGLSLQMMRTEIIEAVNRLRGHGDTQLHYYDGLKLFPESMIGTNLPDQLHPDGDGYEAMGHHMADHILPTMGF